MDGLDNPGRANELLFEKYEIQFFIDPTFPRLTKDNLRDAIELAVDNLVIESIELPELRPLYECTLDKVTENVNAEWMIHNIALWHDVILRQYGTTLSNGQRVSYPILRKKRGRRRGKFIVGIVRLDNEDNVLGRAYVGYFYNGPSVIAMNVQWLNGELTFDYPTPGEIAGVVVHEMLHTFGLSHPTTGTKHKGTFIGEYGYCLPRRFGGMSEEYGLFLKQEKEREIVERAKNLSDGDKLFFVIIKYDRTQLFEDPLVETYEVFWEDVLEEDEVRYDLYYVYMKNIDTATKKLIVEWRKLSYVYSVEQQDTSFRFEGERVNLVSLQAMKN